MLSSFLLVERDEENAKSIEESQGDSDYRNRRPGDKFTKLFTRLFRRYILDISRRVRIKMFYIVTYVKLN